MPKQGEIDYLKNIGEHAATGAVNKPFSEPACWRNLMEMGAIISMFPPVPARILDLGCGTGWTSRFFARMGHEVVGVDICPDMIVRGDEARQREGLENLSFMVRDYEELAFQDEFDVVVFYDALHHAVDEKLALRRAFEALKPGGICLTSEPGEGHSVAPHSLRAMEEFGVTEKDMPPWKIQAMGREIGFGWSRCFPFAWDNAVIPYDGEPVSKLATLKTGNLLKRAWHRLVRWRFQLKPNEYQAWRQLQPVAQRLVRLWDMDRAGGLTLLAKPSGEQPPDTSAGDEQLLSGRAAGTLRWPRLVSGKSF